MANLGDLADFMDSFLQRNAAGYLASALATRAAGAIIQELAMHTPADVGDAVSNWQVSLDAPTASVIPAFTPSPKGHVVKGVWTHSVPPAATILANAVRVLAQSKSVLTLKKPGQPIFITNNVAYIERLNEGSSEQAPANFVERARIVGEKAIEQSLTLVNAMNATSVPVTKLLE